LPEKYFDKNCYANLQNSFADSPHPIVNKNPGFRALHIAGRNECGFLRLINTFFHFWLLASGRKI